MLVEPAVARAIAFFDAQNLYHHAKDAFGHHHPNYDPIKLLDAICKDKGWANCGVRLYTGVPDARRDPFWHAYWAKRFLAMRRAGIVVESRPLKYRKRVVEATDGATELVVQEKGIDLRLALDAVRLAREGQLDVAVIFSQDQDLAEVAVEIKRIARDAGRWIKVMSAFPSSPCAQVKRGLEGTDWYRMSQAFYDACLDHRDYRPKNFR